MTSRCNSCKHIYMTSESHECPTESYVNARNAIVAEASEADIDEEEESTYMIRRFYFKNHAAETIHRGMTLDEAREWCQDDESNSRTCTSKEYKKHTNDMGPWFDGYEKES